MEASGFAVPQHRSERWVFLALAVSVLVHVVLRAIHVPFVHDESASVLWYAERGEVLPFLAHWDANNHVLSSAIGAVSVHLFGLSALAIRIGSVLAFVLFAWASFRLGNRIRNQLIRRSFWAALLLCPFLLDFFSLFRGYGLEMAFLLVAVDGGLTYAEQRRTQDLVQLLLGAFLADLAVLALIPLWAALIALLGVVLIRSSRSKVQWVLWVLLGVLPCAAGVFVAFRMREMGLLYHGSTDGFLAVTAQPLLGFLFGTTDVLVAVLTGALLVGATAFLIRVRHQAGVLIAALFWGDVLLRIGMAWVLGVNYPEDRAALHLVPLLLLLFVFALDALAQRWQRAPWLAMVLLFLPARTITHANTDHTLLWPEQSVPTRFIARMVTLQQEQQRPLVIGAYHQLNLCLALNARINGLSVNAPEVDGFPNGPHDVRIVDARFLEEASVGYHAVDHAPGPGLHLLVPDAPINWTVIEERSVPEPPADAEFVEVFAVDSVVHDHDLLVEVTASVLDPEGRLNAYLVSSTSQAELDMRYDAVPLGLYRTTSTGGAIHLARLLPADPAADRRVAYFWNVRPPGTRFSGITVRVYESTER